MPPSGSHSGLKAQGESYIVLRCSAVCAVLHQPLGTPSEALPSFRLELPFFVRMRCSTSRFRGNGAAFNTEGRSDLENFRWHFSPPSGYICQFSRCYNRCLPFFFFPRIPRNYCYRRRWSKQQKNEVEVCSSSTGHCCRGGAPNIAALKAAAIKEGSSAHCTLQARVH